MKREGKEEAEEESDGREGDLMALLYCRFLHQSHDVEDLIK